MIPPGKKHIAGLLAALLLIGFNIVYVSASTGFIHSAAAVLETDHYRYLEMARRSNDLTRSKLAHEPPFCWRFLIPLIVFGLTKTGLSLNPAYYLTTNIFLVGYLFLFYLYLRRSGFELKYALTGLILIALTPGAVRWYEYQYWMTDPAGLFFVILGFYLIRSENTFGLLAVSIIAVAIRETYLAVLVYYFFFLWKRSGLTAALKKSAPVILIPAAVLILIRFLIAPSGDYNLIETASRVISFRVENLWPQQLYLLTLGSFGVIFPLLFLFPDTILRSCKNHYDSLIYVIIIYLSLGAGYNTDRLLVYTLPVLLVGALTNLKKYLAYLKPPPAGAMILIIALQAFFYASTKFYGYPAVSIFQPPNLPVSICMFAFWALGCAAFYGRKRTPASEKIGRIS